MVTAAGMLPAPMKAATAHAPAMSKPPATDARIATPKAAGPTRVTTARPGGVGNTTWATMPATTCPAMAAPTAASTHQPHLPDSPAASGAAISPTNIPPDRDTARRSKTQSPGCKPPSTRCPPHPLTVRGWRGDGQLSRSPALVPFQPKGWSPAEDLSGSRRGCRRDRGRRSRRCRHGAVLSACDRRPGPCPARGLRPSALRASP